MLPKTVNTRKQLKLTLQSVSKCCLGGRGQAANVRGGWPWQGPQSRGAWLRVEPSGLRAHSRRIVSASREKLSEGHDLYDYLVCSRVLYPLAEAQRNRVEIFFLRTFFGAPSPPPRRFWFSTTLPGMTNAMPRRQPLETLGQTCKKTCMFFKLISTI